MQAINFNDTLNDQNVSVFVSSQEEAQYFIDAIHQMHKKLQMEYTKGEYQSDQGETSRQLLLNELTKVQSEILSLDELLGNMSEGALKDDTQLARDKAYVKEREVRKRYEAKCGFGFIKNKFETEVEFAFKKELRETVKVVVDYANLQGWTINHFDLLPEVAVV
ncbi:hypothetical protein [Flammeovirga sp. SJP92]|uniref:hypothetical protein n=1 Tax=Flammeovirga sp. SJP92 TaxID=1775430 RepID=UPI000787F260|nr:hypothetical protein [Flammeovirga sp. SJP92]KXX71680.1 hypothetical protein AVL50_05245 [Flammeovirga sp. SJP92]